MAKTYWHLADSRLIKRDLIADYTRGHKKKYTKLGTAATLLMITGATLLSFGLQEKTPEVVAVNAPLPQVITVAASNAEEATQTNQASDAPSAIAPSSWIATRRQRTVTGAGSSQAVTTPIESSTPGLPVGGSGGGELPAEEVPVDPVPEVPICEPSIIDEVVDMLPIIGPEEDC